MRASVGRTLYLLKTLHFQRICPTYACTKPNALMWASLEGGPHGGGAELLLGKDVDVDEDEDDEDEDEDEDEDLTRGRGDRQG